MGLITKLALLKNILIAKYIKPIPVYCQWEVTERCNLRCSFCGVISESPKWKPELDTAGAKDIIDQLTNMGTRIIHFSGGEPTLRDDLATLISYAKSKGIVTVVTTNGSTTDQRMCQAIGADYIRISLDGLEDTHNRLRGSKMAFQRVLAATELLKTNGIVPVYTSLVSSQTTVNDMQELVDFTREKKGRIQFTLAGISMSRKENPQPEDIKEEQKFFLLKIGRFLGMVRDIYRRNRDVVLFNYSYMDVLKGGGLDKVGCRALQFAISIKPNGWISFPCNEYPMEVWKGRLADGYYSQKADKVRSAMGKWWFCKGCIIRCMISASNLYGYKNIFLTYLSWRRFNR